jgi:hypothetical protein
MNRILSSALILVNVWSNPEKIKSLTSNEIPGCFGKNRSLGVGVSENSGEFKVNTIYNTLENINETLYILLGKAMTDICEHIFGESHMLCASRIQDAATVGSAFQKMMITNLHEGTATLIHARIYSLIYN